MFLKRLGIAGLVIGAGLAAAACSDGYGYSGLSVGYGAGGYGDGYYDGYGDYGYGGGYYGDAYYGGYGYPSYFGWYGDFYYPGTGVYVYDRYRRAYRWNDNQRRYWEGRRNYYRGNRGGVRDNWGGFQRHDGDGRGYTGGRGYDGRGTGTYRGGYRGDRTGSYRGQPGDATTQAFTRTPEATPRTYGTREAGQPRAAVRARSGRIDGGRGGRGRINRD